jgi:long-subunit fatty acid transport protein
LVTTFNLGDRNNTGWKSLNFGFGYNRTNSFQNRISVQGYNKTSSLLDTYVAAANGYTSAEFDGFSTNLAWQTFLINNPDSTRPTLYDHVIKNYGELQKKSVETSGSMGETDLSFGGNYNNKVFVGATLGIVNAKYNEESVYQEVDEKDTIKGFKSFSLSQSLTTTGTGVNFKFGMIVKATDWMRIGLAVHTPTVLHLSDSYNSTMNSDLERGITYEQKSPDGKFNYTVTTPFRMLGSIGFVVNKNALLNAEYEYVDYTNAQLNSSPNVFTDVNNTIRSKYTSAGNIRMGGEIRMDPLAFRVGYAFYGSPFKNGENVNANRTSYTAGIGFRENDYFIDFAYVFTKYTAYDYLYDPSIVSSVKNDYKNSSFMLTCGVKF